MSEMPVTPFSDVPRTVYGGDDNPFGYCYRARVEKRVRRGREQFRFVGEQKFIYWREHGPDFPQQGDKSKWFGTAIEAADAANRWLDSKEYTADPRYKAIGYVAARSRSGYNCLGCGVWVQEADLHSCRALLPAPTVHGVSEDRLREIVREEISAHHEACRVRAMKA